MTTFYLAHSKAQILDLIDIILVCLKRWMEIFMQQREPHLGELLATHVSCVYLYMRVQHENGHSTSWTRCAFLRVLRI